MNVEEKIRTASKLPLERRTVIHLILVGNRINEILNKTLKPFGVSLQQFNVLRILRGQKGKPANLSTLNQRMVHKMSNTTRLVDKLVARGYVDRKVCPSNRRKIEIRITDDGSRALALMDAAVDGAEEALTKNLTDQQMEALNALLDQM